MPGREGAGAPNPLGGAPGIAGVAAGAPMDEGPGGPRGAGEGMPMGLGVAEG